MKKSVTSLAVGLGLIAPLAISYAADKAKFAEIDLSPGFDMANIGSTAAGEIQFDRANCRYLGRDSAPVDVHYAACDVSFEILALSDPIALPQPLKYLDAARVDVGVVLPSVDAVLNMEASSLGAWGAPTDQPSVANFASLDCRYRYGAFIQPVTHTGAMPMNIAFQAVDQNNHLSAVLYGYAVGNFSSPVAIHFVRCSLNFTLETSSNAVPAVPTLSNDILLNPSVTVVLDEITTNGLALSKDQPV